MKIILTIKKFEDVERLYTNLGLDIPTKEQKSYTLDCDLKLRQKLYSQDWFFKSNSIALEPPTDNMYYVMFLEKEDLLQDIRSHFKNDLNVWCWLIPNGVFIGGYLDSTTQNWLHRRRIKYPDSPEEC